MTAPMASMTRSPAPSTRFSEWGPPSEGWRSAMGLRAKSWDAKSVETIHGIVRRDHQFSTRAERDADQRASRDHELRLGVDIGKAVQAAGAGQRVDHVQSAVG